MSNTRNDSVEQKNDLGQQLNIQQRLAIDTASGVLTGAFCAGVFNPWDRALYLSVKNKRPFLLKSNFTSPYHGFSQAVLQRTFQNSIYFIMQSELKHSMHPYLRNNLNMSESSTQFCIGLFAGSVSGFLTNGISAVKYHTWGQEDRSFLSSTREMWSQGGYKIFFKGIIPTIQRDMVSGSTYEVVRHLMRDHFQKPNDPKNSLTNFICNSAAAGLATMTASPLNWLRNLYYATPPDKKPPSTLDASKNIWQESKIHSQKISGRLGFFQKRFGVGWGTARVAVSTGVGQLVCDAIRTQLTETYTEHLNKSYKK